MECWVWRIAFWLMLIGISAMIISCASSIPATAVFTPTGLPPITLTLWIAATSTPIFSTVLPITATPAPFITQTPITYVVNPGESLDQIADDFGIEVDSLQAANLELRTQPPRIGQSLIIPRNLPTLVPQSLEMNPPTCYTTLSDMYLCLGYVHNQTTQPVSRVSVQVELLNTQGEWVAAQTSDIEQRTIPPGVSAPYRILFGTRKAEHTQMIVALRSADPAPVTSQLVVSPQLVVDGETAIHQAGAYQVEATLTNSSTTSLENVRVVLTLYGDEQQVVGYRVVDLGALEAESSVPLRLTLHPMTAAQNLTHTLYAEGWSE